VSKVVIVGSYVVDLMSRTPHMPSPGETVLGGPFRMGPGGKGSNQAVAAARQGSEVTMVTKVGMDVFGNEAIKNFENEGIDATFVTRHPEEATGAALITVDKQSENMIVVALGACGKITNGDVLSAEKAFMDADIVLLQLETSLEAIEKTVALAKKYEKPIVLNPAPYQEIDENLLSGITYITPNETEASLLTDINVEDEESAKMASQRLIEKGINTVIITLGKQGCFVYDGIDDGQLIKGFKVDAVDTTGAGDSFNGAFATFIANGMDLDDAVNRANAVAALSVTKVGTAPAMPFVNEVDRLMRGMD